MPKIDVKENGNALYYNGVYKPSDEDRKIVEFIYKEFEDMRFVKEQSYLELNDRTIKQFVDDCQKRANAYVPSKESQGKDSWRSNVFTQTTRNKVKTLLASIAKTPPVTHISAVNDKNEISINRSEVMESLVAASYVQGDTNPEITIFDDGWNCAINGTVIKYDGYLYVKNKVKMITDIDLETGEVKWDETDEVVEDRPIELHIPIQNFFVRDMRICHVQDQSAVAWVDYITREQFDYEFGHYKRAKDVRYAGYRFSQTDIATFFVDKWSDRVTDDNLVEVIRYYNKYKDLYCIIANGVLLLKSPMLWGRRKKKYPFAKTVFEPFADNQFFYGNSLPNILMGQQDLENAFINSMVDKNLRSLVTPLLIGLSNKDAFDLEDEYVDDDTKIYVDDVTQVRDLPTPQIHQSEINMLNLIRSDMDKSSTDSIQGGASGSGSTAREIVIANERAEELKGLFFINIKDLWLQKVRLRCLNILMHYSQARVEEIVGEDGAKTFSEQFKTFVVPNAKLSDETYGNLAVEVVKDRSQLQKPFDLGVREEKQRIEGRPIEIVQITSDFLDDFEYVVQIETEALYQKQKSLKIALNDEYIKGVAGLFPEVFMHNKEAFFKRYAEGYGDTPDKYLKTPEAIPTPMLGQEQMAGDEGQPPQMGQNELMAELTQPTKTLPQVAVNP